MIKVITTISNEHYIHNDVINHCKSADYIQTIIHYDKTAALFTLLVLAIVYQNIDFKLHYDLNNSTELMILMFVKDIKTKKFI